MLLIYLVAFFLHIIQIMCILLYKIVCNMSTIGNINGGGGNLDFSYRSKVLKGLQKSVDGLQLINANTGLLAGLATEGTLQSVLTAIQNGTDYETKLVVDSNDDTWLEVRIWNIGSQTFDPPIYYAAGSNIVGIPVAPITYINPTTLLSQIASNTTGISLEATQLSVLTELQSVNLNIGNLSEEATQLLVLTALNNILLDTANLDTPLSNLSSETTQLLVLTALNSIISNTTGLATEITLNAVDTKLNSIIVTPSLIRSTGAGTIFAGAYSFSVANVGLLDGILLGVAIRPGEIISFDAGSLNNTYGAVSYDGTGTELLITVNS